MAGELGSVEGAQTMIDPTIAAQVEAAWSERDQQLYDVAVLEDMLAVSGIAHAAEIVEVPEPPRRIDSKTHRAQPTSKATSQQVGAPKPPQTLEELFQARALKAERSIDPVEVLRARKIEANNMKRNQASL